jgi:hypothetical protein
VNLLAPELARMTRPPVMLALLAFLALLAAAPPAAATVYGHGACILRNNAPGQHYPPEPNRDDTRKALGLAGDEQNSLGNFAVYQDAQAFALMQKIDNAGTDALAALPPDTPRIDFVIDAHLSNLARVRTMMGLFYEQARVARRADNAQAAAFYQKALDTRFVDDRGCAHTPLVSSNMLRHYAGLLIYGEGVPQDKAKAKILLTDCCLREVGRSLRPFARLRRLGFWGGILAPCFFSGNAAGWVGRAKPSLRIKRAGRPLQA